jgi:two-component system, NtrC family, sensor kinase
VPADTVDVETLESTATASPIVTPGPTGPPLRVLIVDDNPAIHEDITKVLAAPAAADAQLAALHGELFDEPGAGSYGGYQIDSAYQGQEDLKLLQAALAEGRPYAVAIVDVRMPPGWDGIETVSRLWEEDPELQIVICTAFSDHSWTEIMDRLQPGDGLLIVRKPFDSTEIRQTTHTLATKWRLHRENRQRLRELQTVVAERTRAWVEASKELRRRNLTPAPSGDLAAVVAGYRALLIRPSSFDPEVLEEMRKIERAAGLTPVEPRSYPPRG